MSRNDLEYERERQRRRVALMRMQGDTNRMEARMHFFWALAAVLGGLALILVAMS